MIKIKNKNEITDKQLQKLPEKQIEKTIDKIVNNNKQVELPTQKKPKKNDKILDGNEDEKNFSMEDIEEEFEESTANENKNKK